MTLRISSDRHHQPGEKEKRQVDTAGEPWWRAYEREPELISAWGGGVDEFYADIERVMRAALGDLAADDRSAAVVASVIGPPTFFALRPRGLSADEAVRLSVELAVPWLERRRDESADRS